MRIVNGRLKTSRPTRTTTTQRLDAVEHQYRQREIKHMSWQTWIALAALVVPSVLAYLAFRDQQTVSRAQQEITKEQQERERRRYADRVTYWDSGSANGDATIHLDNRSTTSIKGVALLDGVPGLPYQLGPGNMAADRLMWIGTVRPCSRVSAAIPRGDLPVPVLGPVGGRSWNSVAVMFHDSVTSWLIDDFDTQEFKYSEFFAFNTIYTALPSATVYPFVKEMVPGQYSVDTDKPRSFPLGTEALPDCGESA